LFRTGGIGDVILTTPLIGQIKKNLPNSKIDYLVGKKAKPQKTLLMLIIMQNLKL